MTAFTLTVATSADGYIARAPDDAPQSWASREEQDLFFRDVEAADWAIMGRHTHQAADKPQRRRIIFSSDISGWQRSTQFWLDPSACTPSQLASLVSEVYPLDHGLVLGGTRVHDWFLAHDAIDCVNLTIEPVTFGQGLQIFTDQASRNPVEVFENRGFQVESSATLNTAGTRYLKLGRYRK